MYGGWLIPFQSFSKFYIVAQKKKEAKAKAAKDGSAPPRRGKGSLYLSVKYYNSEDLLALAGDRAVGNVLEQALVFLPLFWMHALFVDPTQSLMIATIYSITRGIYPIVYLMAFTGHLSMIFLSTAPGYLVTVYLFYKIASEFVFS